MDKTMSEIQAGDVVELKSGSAPMTVEGVIKHKDLPTRAVCKWENGQGHHVEKEYKTVALKKVNLG